MNTVVSKSLLFLLLICGSCACSSSSIKAEPISPAPADNLYPPSTIVISTHTDYARTHYPQRIAEFKNNPLQKGDIVFLGNSITEKGGDWALKVNNPKARNRGIAGDTTEGVLARLGEIIYYQPTQIYIMIGINDMFHDSMTATKIYENIVEIVNKIHLGSPSTKIFVETILPTTTVSLIEKIKTTNALLLNSEATSSYTMLSLHSYFAMPDGTMNMNYSVDGLHLNENGYALWVGKIKNLVN